MCACVRPARRLPAEVSLTGREERVKDTYSCTQRGQGSAHFEIVIVFHH